MWRMLNENIYMLNENHQSCIVMQLFCFSFWCLSATPPPCFSPPPGISLKQITNQVRRIQEEKKKEKVGDESDDDEMTGDNAV